MPSDQCYRSETGESVFDSETTRLVLTQAFTYELTLSSRDVNIEFLLVVLDTFLMVFVRRIALTIKQFSDGDLFINSRALCVGVCIDITRRNLILIIIDRTRMRARGPAPVPPSPGHTPGDSFKRRISCSVYTKGV